jgi:hypothetical protein
LEFESDGNSNWEAQLFFQKEGERFFFVHGKRMRTGGTMKTRKTQKPQPSNPNSNPHTILPENQSQENLIVPLRQLAFATLASSSCTTRHILSISHSSFVYGLTGLDFHEWVTETLHFNTIDAIVLGMFLTSNGVFTPLNASSPGSPRACPFRLDSFYVVENLEAVVAEQLHTYVQFVQQTEHQTFLTLLPLVSPRTPDVSSSSSFSPSLFALKASRSPPNFRDRSPLKKRGQAAGRKALHSELLDEIHNKGKPLEDLLFVDPEFVDSVEFLAEQIGVFRKMYSQIYQKETQGSKPPLPPPPHSLSHTLSLSLARPEQIEKSLGTPISKEQKLDLIKRISLSLQRRVFDFQHILQLHEAENSQNKV